MIATIELETLTTHECRDCGNRHLIRAEVIADDEHTAPPPALVGFFGVCPQSGERVWFVVEAPERAEPVRLARFGPIDDDRWEPDEAVDVDPTTQARAGVGRLSLPQRGMTNGGFRAAARRPDVLRLAWGCPFST